ncbi:hypothetical protein U1Q18_009382 [Sarracenia purpurea var. burkii]
MIDNIYTNGGDGSTQRHGSIIIGEQLDVEAYVALYNGRTKTTRLLFIANHYDVISTQLEVLRMAYDAVKRGENTQLF